MEPLSTLVTAVVVGAAAALKETAATAIKDAYAALKQRLRDSFGVEVSVVETDHPSESRKEVLREELEQSAAHKDAAIATLANQVLDIVRRECPEVALEVGVRLHDITGGSLNVRRVESVADGVVVTKARIEGEINIEDVKAGVGDPPPK
jgi:hypothetical protein